MPRRSEFLELVLEQLATVGRLRARAMFGGYGIYRDDRIFAIIADGRLFFKADEAVRGDFEARGLAPFTYIARGKTVTMQYFEAPPDVFDDAEAMRHWAGKALGAAARSSGAAKTVRRARLRARPR